MSVTTTADERRRSALEHLEEAYKDILIFLNPDTWGNSEYSSEYKEEMHEVLTELNKLKSKL